MGDSTSFGVPVLTAHTGIGIWKFSPVAVSHFYGVMSIDMVAIIIPIECFEVQDMRTVKGHHQEIDPWGTQQKCHKVSQRKGASWIQKYCKNIKSAVKSEKGLLFDAIRERLNKIIQENRFEIVPNAFKFKVKNCVCLCGLPSAVGYVVGTSKKCLQIFHDEDMSKAEVNIKFGRNMGIVHVCQNVREVTGELRGNWVDAHQVAAGIRLLMNL